MQILTSLTPYLATILRCLAAIVGAILLGNGAVYFFNKMPAGWFVDYGQEPSEEMKDPYRQRIKSLPWKIIFTMLFSAIAIYMVVDDARFAIAALCTIWLLVEIAIGDVLYRIIPDQLVILTALSAIGYIPYFDSWIQNLIGLGVGAALMGGVAALGYLIYRREVVGGGDIKLFAAIAFIVGGLGALEIFAIATLLAACYSIASRLGILPWARSAESARRAKHAQRMVPSEGEHSLKDEKYGIPMAPFLAIATSIHLVFLWGYLDALFLL